MGCYKNRPIWSFQSIPGVFEREFTVDFFNIFLKVVPDTNWDTNIEGLGYLYTFKLNKFNRANK
jgi:hypothetical protein